VRQSLEQTAVVLVLPQLRRVKNKSLRKVIAQRHLPQRRLRQAAMLVDMEWGAERYRASLARIGPEKTNQVGLAHLRIGNGESRVPDESAINEIPRNPFFQREIREIGEVAVDEVEYDADERDAQVEPNRRRTTDQAVEIVALQRLESTDG
jgi:hypothetical protein